MAWKKTEHLVQKRLNQHGLTEVVAATRLCQKAEELLPGIFHAVSIRNSYLHLHIEKAQLLAFKLEEGRLLAELQAYARAEKLPYPERFKLTIR